MLKNFFCFDMLQKKNNVVSTLKITKIRLNSEKIVQPQYIKIIKDQFLFNVKYSNLSWTVQTTCLLARIVNNMLLVIQYGTKVINI